MAEKIVQTAGRTQLGEFAPEFAHFNDACEIIGLSRKSLINQGLQLESYFLDQLNGTQTLPDENLCSAA